MYDLIDVSYIAQDIGSTGSNSDVIWWQLPVSSAFWIANTISLTCNENLADNRHGRSPEMAAASSLTPLAKSM